MAMEVNGKAMLSSLIRTPSAFAFSETQLNILAMATLLGRLKDKSVDLGIVRSMAAAIGQHDFDLALDHLADRDAAALARRLDAKNPELKSSTPPQHRVRISALARGLAEPVTSAPKPTKGISPSATRSRKSKTGDVMESKALKPRSSTPRGRSKTSSA